MRQVQGWQNTSGRVLVVQLMIWLAFFGSFVLYFMNDVAELGIHPLVIEEVYTALAVLGALHIYIAPAAISWRKTGGLEFKPRRSQHARSHTLPFPFTTHSTTHLHP